MVRSKWQHWGDNVVLRGLAIPSPWGMHHRLSGVGATGYNYSYSVSPMVVLGHRLYPECHIPSLQTAATYVSDWFIAVGRTAN